MVDTSSKYKKEQRTVASCSMTMYPSPLAKSTVTYMIYFLDSTKVPFIISHAYHENALLFLPYTVLFQSVLLGLRFIHNRTYIKQIISLFLYIYSIFKINHSSYGIILD